MKKYFTKTGKELKLTVPETGHFKVLVVGVVHGDEPQGYYLINNYLKQVSKTNIGFIPALNPDGLEKGTRTNSNGVDLNRNFPTENWISSKKDEYWGGEKPASEEETKFLIAVIDKYTPELIITLHAPYKVVNYDGNGYNYACEISKIIGYPVSSDIGYPTPGSFGTYAGIEKNIPTITLELDENCLIKDLEPSVFSIFKYLESISL